MKSSLARILTLGGITALAAGALAACGHADASGADVTAVASFYPLQFVTEEVGGAHVAVSNLTAPGAEPHDLELAPRQMADITDADLVVYLDGFQPAVDDAVAQQAPETSLDTASVTTLDVSADPHADHAEEADHDHGALDPHMWLDPTKLNEIAGAVADRLAKADPDHAADYQANAEALGQKLTALDADYSAGLADCRSRELVTSHAAFGYLADRYGLDQVAVSGLTPDSEPRSEAIKQVADYVADHDVTTVFYETLVDPAVADTIAAETGAATAVLDPIEGLEPDSKDDYVSIMQSNLDTLREALGCQK